MSLLTFYHIYYEFHQKIPFLWYITGYRFYLKVEDLKVNTSFLINPYNIYFLFFSLCDSVVFH